MKTGIYIYKDGSNSTEFDSSKELKGILCNVTDEKSVIICPFKSEVKLDWFNAKKYCEDKKCFLPSKEDLMGIYLKKDNINESFEKADLEPLKEDEFYWSSTELSDYSSWILGMNNGGISHNGNGSYYYVLAVVPLY